MNRVEEWLPEFYGKHIIRCPREDWPDAGTEDEETTLYSWRHAFVTRGVEHRFADVASLDMASEPPRFLSDHLPTIVRLAIELRLREDAGLKAEPVTSREAAESASKGCVDCQGCGVTTRYVEERGGNFGFACRCPMGRWMKAQHGADCRLRDDPYWLPTRRPSEVDIPDIQTPAELRAFIASLAGSKSSRGGFVPSHFRQPQAWDARAVPGHADLAGASDDPVVARELAPPPPPKQAALVIPEDDAASGWY